jgi:hypothetical protein
MGFNSAFKGLIGDFRARMNSLNMRVMKCHCHIGALCCSEVLDIVGFDGYYPLFMLDVFKKCKGLIYLSSSTANSSHRKPTSAVLRAMIKNTLLFCCAYFSR